MRIMIDGEFGHHLQMIIVTTICVKTYGNVLVSASVELWGCDLTVIDECNVLKH